MPGKLLTQEIEKTLDLLEFVFETSEKVESAKEVKVSVTSLDIKKANLTIEDLAITLHKLKDTILGLRVDYIYDFVNGPDEDNFNNPDPYPALAVISLPSDFPKLLKNLRQNPSRVKGGITSITCVPSEFGDSEFLVVVNKNFLNAFSLKNKGSSQILYEVAKEGRYDFDDQEKSGVKRAVDYFNTHSSNKIYTQTGLSLTPVLKIDGETVYPLVEIKIMSNKEFKKSQTKQLKST